MTACGGRLGFTRINLFRCPYPKLWEKPSGLQKNFTLPMLDKAAIDRAPAQPSREPRPLCMADKPILSRDKAQQSAAPLPLLLTAACQPVPIH